LGRFDRRPAPGRLAADAPQKRLTVTRRAVVRSAVDAETRRVRLAITPDHVLGAGSTSGSTAPGAHICDPATGREGVRPTPARGRRRTASFRRGARRCRLDTAGERRAMAAAAEMPRNRAAA